MPPSRDYSMLKVNTKALSIAMANAELQPKELAAKAGVSDNIIYTIRRGCLIKPVYIGKVCKALNVKVEDIVE